MTLAVCLHLWSQLPVTHQMHVGGAEAESSSVVLYVSLPSLGLSLQWGEVTDPPLLQLYVGYVKTVTPSEKLRLSQLGLLLF